MALSSLFRFFLVALVASICATSALAQNLSSLTTPLAMASGERTSIADLGRGKVTVLVFWITSCQPSKHELDALQELSTTMGDSVSIVAVSIDNTKTMARVGSLVRSKGYSFPVLLDPNSDLFNALNGQDHPYTLIFNREGMVTEKLSGFLQGDELKLVGAIRAAVKSPASQPGR
jgi:cytochrome c biogenesis protein CcmG, thiol:disulfide interchange protein DsbE